MPDTYVDLYKTIYDSLVNNFNPQTVDEGILVSHITMIVGEAVTEYISELTEAIGHLQETVRRVNA